MKYEVIMNAKIPPSSLHAFFSRGRMQGFEDVTIIKLFAKNILCRDPVERAGNFFQGASNALNIEQKH